MLFLLWPLECHRKPEILLDNPDKENRSHNGPPVNILFFSIKRKILLTSDFQVGLVEFRFLLKAERWCDDDTGKRDAGLDGLKQKAEERLVLLGNCWM